MPAAMPGVAAAGAVTSRCDPRPSRDAPVPASQSASSERDFSQDQRRHVATRRDLLPVGVDFPLGDDRHRLVGRQRVDREEARRMAGEPVDRHHPDPAVDGVERSALRRAPAGRPCRAADLAQRVRVVERQQLLGTFRLRRPIHASRVDPRTASSDGGRSRGSTSIRLSGLTSQPTGTRPSSAASSTRRPAPHERVVDDVARAR